MAEPTSEDLLLNLFIITIIGIFEFFILIAFFPSPCGFFGCCGDDYLYLLEDTLATFQGLLIIAIFQLTLGLILLKWRPLIGSLLLIFGVVGMLISVKLWQDIPERADYYEEFNARKWHSEQPIPMVRGFIKDERFIGKTRLEIIMVFGEKYREYQDPYLMCSPNRKLGLNLKQF